MLDKTKVSSQHLFWDQLSEVIWKINIVKTPEIPRFNIHDRMHFNSNSSLQYYSKLNSIVDIFLGLSLQLTHPIFFQIIFKFTNTIFQLIFIINKLIE